MAKRCEGGNNGGPGGIWPGWYIIVFTVGLAIFLISMAKELELLNRIMLIYILKAASILFLIITIPAFFIHIRRNTLRWARNDIISMGLCTTVVAGLCILSCYLQRPVPQGCMIACKSNLKNIGTALQMYSADNASLFPEHLTQITPNYLKVIPTCASSGYMTYSYVRSGEQKHYTIFCEGNYHRHKYGADNFPQYSSTYRLVESPESLDMIYLRTADTLSQEWSFPLSHSE